MKRFVQESLLHANNHILPTEYRSEFGKLFECDIEPALQGSLQVTIHGEHIKRFDPRQVTHWSLCSLSNEVSFPKCYHRCILSGDELSQLRRIYTSFYPHILLDYASLNTVCLRYSTLLYSRVRYKERTLVYATDNTSLLPTSSCTETSMCTALDDMQPRPALLKYFIRHSFHYKDDVYMHLFAVVSWLKSHHAKDSYVKPFQICRKIYMMQT